MKIKIALILFLLTTSAFSESKFESVHSFYEDLFNVEESLPQVKINPKGCLRTGYNIKSNTVIFCSNSKTINSGLDSIDVIAHEFFHYYMCNENRDYCESSITDPHKKAVLEAFADTFSYWLNQDLYFGENYYKDQYSIRDYSNSYCYSLVKGIHNKGSALASKLIKLPVDDVIALVKNRSYDLKDLSVALDDPCISLQQGVSVIPLNGETSKLNRYSISESGREFSVEYNLSQKFSLKFKESKLFRIKQAGNGITIYPKNKKGHEKVIMGIFSDGRLVGNIPLYFKTVKKTQ